jgi:L-aspartate oxidase
VRAAPHVTAIEDGRLVGLMQDAQGRAGGALIARGRRLVEITAPSVVLATGGAGGLYAMTTNPSALRGEGLGLAALAGADILDPEFVQFHPTAINVGLDPAPLATEALRGEGARLIDASGAFLLGDAADADLAARDIVARAVHRAVRSGRGAFLDARHAIGAHFPEAFPAVFAACLGAGLDPREQPIPVAAAAHYHMGGIAADADGRTSLEGLFAVGECAATGVHGANRLASNSLLEAAAFGRRTGFAAAQATGAGGGDAGLVAPALSAEALAALRQAMTADAGVERDAGGLTRLIGVIDRLEIEAPRAPALVASRLIAQAALDRRESRGGHFRSDYPEAAPEARHSRITLAAGQAFRSAAA